MDHNKTRETNHYQPCQRTINRRLEIPFEFRSKLCTNKQTKNTFMNIITTTESTVWDLDTETKELLLNLCAKK